MNLSYILLGLTVPICLFAKNRNLMLLAIFMTIITAYYQGIISSTAAVGILLFFAISYSYFNYNGLNKYLRYALFIIMLTLTAGYIFHLMPGFTNVLVINKTQVSSLSSSFSMYLNFDKTIIALILYVTSGLWMLEKSIDKKSILDTLLCLLLCIGVILIPGILSGYIKFDPKIPEILCLWVFNNLLFVSATEEMIFRGILQNNLKSFLGTRATNYYLHIIIASIIFGLSHYKGGVTFMLLAAISGGFYGYIYDKTNRIFCATLVHFGLNLVHLMLFTYPSAIVVY